ncbi:MAG: hypothetical protein JAY61_01190 [Candidatus Thiodiazotropha taylori]|nr:hypothetical protein [Candidatus Thiodiazotropha taylori]MCG7941699.1 hypothetical protein [Candidatus Thiodiazotropha taylori]
MIIRTTLDPITLRNVTNPDDHPGLYEGDGEHAVEIHFENEQIRQSYLEDRKVICGNDSDDYLAEG